MHVKEAVQQEHARGSDEDQQGHLHSGFLIHFGDQIGRGHVDGNARRQGQAKTHFVTEDGHGHDSCDGCNAEKHGRSPGGGAAAAAGQHHRRDGEAFRNFVQKNREEDDPAEGGRNQESRGDGDAVEEGVDQQANQYRISHVSMDELVGVGLFSEVEMRGDGVLEEMDEQVSEQDEKPGILAAQFNAFRHHFDEGRRQHEARSQSDEVAKVGALPISLDDDGAAEDVGGGRRQAEQHAGQYGGH